MSEFTEQTQVAAAGHMLERARWASRSYSEFSTADVNRIVRAVSEAAHDSAHKYAEWAVRETTFGVVEHKVIKNQACSRGIVETYAEQDYVAPRIDSHRKIIEVPRPAGVVLALTPSTNPVSTVFFKVILALMTRNAIVISPHPMARQCCFDAAQMLAREAVAAGAPDGVVQCIAEPTIPLVESLMADERTNAILATGGTGVVRAAYSSGNPAMGVGPGNVPVLVDRTADIGNAAKRIIESKAFDNSTLCTNESVLIAEDAIADRLTRDLSHAGAAVLDASAARQLAAYMFPGGRLNTQVVGKAAAWIAREAGIRIDPRAKVIVAPFEVAVPEEPFTHEKLSPVLGMVRVPSAQRGTQAARAIVRIGGAGHSAAIHSTDPTTIMDYAARVPVLRVSVNVGNSAGSAGLSTNLAPSMTIGTGFVGRSSLGENLEPQHLVNWTRIAYSSEPSEFMPDFTGKLPWKHVTGPVPPYPLASNDPSVPVPPVAAAARNHTEGKVEPPTTSAEHDRFREEVRRLVIAELSELTKGYRG